jgi:hypothetical protein
MPFMKAAIVGKDDEKFFSDSDNEEKLEAATKIAPKPGSYDAEAGAADEAAKTGKTGPAAKAGADAAKGGPKLPPPPQPSGAAKPMARVKRAMPPE